MTHIHWISPVVASGDWTQETTYKETLQEFERDGLLLTNSFLSRGPYSIEYRLEEAMLIPDLINEAVQAQNKGADGIIIDCMADPGVDVLRECLSIPVLGPGRLSMLMATMLGRRFSILTELDIVSRLFEEEVKRYGVESSFASCRSIDIPVLELDNDPGVTTEKLVEAGIKAVTEDHADILVLGCTRFAILRDRLQSLLAERGCPVQVINPNVLAINTMISLIESDLSHSKVAYPSPIGKEICGFETPVFN